METMTEFPSNNVPVRGVLPSPNSNPNLLVSALPRPLPLQCRTTLPHSTSFRTRVPPELLLHIVSFIQHTQSLISFANTCRWYRSVLLSDATIIRNRLSVDLTPFASIVDDSRLDGLISNHFKPMGGRHVRELILSDSRVRDLNTVIMPGTVSRIPGLTHLDLSRAKTYFPSHQFRGTHTSWMRHLHSLSIAHTTGLSDTALHSLMHTVAPNLQVLDLSFCDKVSDAGIGCVMRAVSDRNVPMSRLKLTGCVLVEGRGWTKSPLVAQLWLNLTSFCTDSLLDLVHASSLSLHYVNVKACAFVDMDLFWGSFIESKSGRLSIIHDRSTY